MSPRMSQWCTLALLLAMTLSLAVGLLAWGPVQLDGADHLYADQRLLLGLPNAVNTLACLPLIAAGLWGMRATLRSHWPAALRAPWLGFFALVTAVSVNSVAYHVAPSDLGHAMSELFAAGAFTLLLLGFLAERAHPAFGSRLPVAAGLGAAALAGLYWAAGQWSSGQGDLRVLLLLQCLPILLIPAGALTLPGPHTTTADWLWMLCLYTAARLAGLGDAALFDATGWISGHTLMHLLLAAVAWRLAYRAGMASEGDAARGEAALEPSRDSTSLNTSS